MTTRQQEDSTFAGVKKMVFDMEGCIGLAERCSDTIGGLIVYVKDASYREVMADVCEDLEMQLVKLRQQLTAIHEALNPAARENVTQLAGRGAGAGRKL